MKNILAGLVAAASLFGLLYAMCALYSCSWASCDWSQDTRGACALFGFLIAVFSFFMVSALTREDERR